MNNYFQNYIKSLNSSLSSLEITDHDGNEIDHVSGLNELVNISGGVSKSHASQYFVGNGASDSFSNHMALDWSKNGGIPSFSLSSSAMLTAIGNDIDFENIFSNLLDWYGKPSDLLITISSSGNSNNIIKAIEAARSKDMKVVTLSGLETNNKSRGLGDLNLYIPAKTYGIVECAHQVLLHAWLDKYMGIMEWDRTKCQNMNLDSFVL